jgi:TetR/AcrR family transcriptional regulator, transcriptional repressor for nem operon
VKSLCYAQKATVQSHMTKGEQTRRKIVAAAAPIFNQKGFEGSSLADLMSATGLQKGGIYRHFSSKEELAAEAFDYTWAAARGARLVKLNDKPPGLARLKQLIANFECRPPVAGGCPVLNTAVDTDDGNPVLRDRVRKALRSWTTSVRSMVRDAIKRGEIRADADPKDVAAVIVASLEGAIMMIRLEGDQDALRRVQQHLYRYLESLERRSR